MASVKPSPAPVASSSAWSALTLILAGSAAIAGESLGTLFLRRIVGSNSLSTYATLAATLGGIGLGAYFPTVFQGQKRWSQRRSVLVTLIALSLLTFAAPSLATAIEGSLAPWLSTRSVILRALCAMLMVLPFAYLQGTLFSSMASSVSRKSEQQVGFVGAASSLGSALGSLLLLTLVAPVVGLSQTLYLAATLFALSALASRNATSEHTNTIDQQKSTPSESTPTLSRVVLGSLVCVGFASTTLQIGALRMLTLSVGPTALTLALVLSAHTLSLAMGEFFLARRAPQARPTMHTLLALACAMTALSALCADRLSQWAQQYFATHTPTSAALTTRGLGWALCILAPTIVCVGTLLARSSTALTDEKPSTSNVTGVTGVVFAASAAGNVLSVAIVPWWVVGKFGPMSAFVAASVAIAFALLLQRRRDRFWVPFVVAIAAMAVVVQTVRHTDYDLHTRAPYLYARNPVLGSLLSIAHSPESTVTVRTDDTGELALHIDGKIDATARSDDDTQTLLALIPAALSARPERALVVGLGSGRTIDALQSVQSVRSITVAERLAPVVNAANGPFAASNHHVLQSPKVHLLVDDALMALRNPSQQYELILSEPSNPWVTGMSELFTVEFFTLAQQRLSANGIFAAWFHSENPTLFAQLLATFRHVYARNALVELNPRGDWLLVGFSPQSAHGTVNVDQFAQVLESPAVRSQLHRIDIDSPATILAKFVAGPDGMAAMTQSIEPLHARELSLEFSSPTILYAQSNASELRTILALAQDLPLAGLSPTGTRYQTLIDEANTLRESALHARQREVFAQQGQLDEAIREGELAVAAAPTLRELRVALARVYVRRASRRYRTNDRGGSEADFRTALEVGPDASDSFRASMILGDLALARREHPQAIRYYRRALAAAEQANAETPELHVRLAQLLVLAGDVAGARAELTIARATCRTDERCAQIATALRQLWVGEM